MNKHSIKCWLWKGLWALSALSLLGAWVSLTVKAPVLGIDPGFLLWNGLIMGVLAISIKLDCVSCGGCSVPRA